MLEVAHRHSPSKMLDSSAPAEGQAYCQETFCGNTGSMKNAAYWGFSVSVGLAMLAGVGCSNSQRGDAAGLGLFAVSGAGKALAFHVGPVAATLLGMLTGIGGGMVRDVLVTEIPSVLRIELYAVAALTGAAAVVIGKSLNIPSSVAAVTGAVLCCGLRFLAMRHGWQLPIARPPETSSPTQALAGHREQ
jgi:uncharacterized membrane protein YeiH